MKNIDELFEIIPAYPGLEIAYIDDGSFDFRKSFIDFAEKTEASLYIKDTNASQKERDSFITVEPFSFDDKRYTKHSILYDYIFVASNLKDKDIEEILKKLYRVAKNSAHVFLFVANEDMDEIKKFLEVTNFVAINDIDKIGKFQIVSAKKMHGWAKV